MATTVLPTPPRTPPPLPRRASADGDLWRIMPLVLLLYAAMLPPEIRFDVADQTIYPPRLVILAAFPWLLNRLAAGEFRFRPADLWIFGGCAWMIVSFVNAYDIVVGVLRGGGVIVDTLGSYIIARICIRSVTDVRRLLVVLAPGLFIAGLSMFIESVTHVQFVRPAAAAIFGQLSAYQDGVAIGQANQFFDVRLGFLRASGPFSHPILAGVFLTCFMALYLRSGLRGWPRLVGIASTAFSFFALSSAAFLGAIIILGLTAYDEVQKRITLVRWKLFIFGSILLAFVLQVVSQGGLLSFIIRGTLNPATGYYRRLIWQFGTQSVERNPVFGIAYENYERLRWMNTSVDNHWLVLAIRHGLVTPIAFGIALLVATVSASVAASRASGKDRDLLVAIAITLFALAVLGFTVAFFGGMLNLFFVVLAAGMSLGQIGHHQPLFYASPATQPSLRR